jgi:hypothetical protein
MAQPRFIDDDTYYGMSHGGSMHGNGWCAWRRFGCDPGQSWSVSFHLPSAVAPGDWLFPLGDVWGCEVFKAVTDDFGTLVKVPS